jgi:hypothetical protein
VVERGFLSSPLEAFGGFGRPHPYDVTLTAEGLRNNANRISFFIGRGLMRWEQVDFAVFGPDELFLRRLGGYLIPARVFEDRNSFDQLVNLARSSIPREAHFSQEDPQLQPVSWRASMLWTLRLQTVSLVAAAVVIMAVMLARG